MSSARLIVRTDLPGTDLALPIERAALAGRPDVALRGVICRSDDEVVAAAAQADVLITNESYITRGVLERLPRLRAVVRYGIGFDRVDLDAATENGIAVVNVPDFCQTELAQYVILGILAWNKRLVPYNAAVKAGRWLEARATLDAGMGPTAGQVLGVYGFGNAGRRVAQLALALDMQVISCSEHLSDADLAMGVRSVSREELFAACDFLSINCALNARTHHAVGAREFGWMKPSAVVINTSRGGLIDEKALIEALRGGQIAGAVLDVREQEPPAPDDPLLNMDNVLLTPHMSYYSSRSYRRLAESVIAEALRCLTPGELPVHVVNRAVLDRENLRLR